MSDTPSNDTPMNGADALVRMLQLNGVKHIFGLCGDTSLPYYDALARLDHGIDHILTRDERSAGYMADAYARVTGRVGVCEGPSGGGATYLLPALVEANESSIHSICRLTTTVNHSSVSLTSTICCSLTPMATGVDPSRTGVSVGMAVPDSTSGALTPTSSR